LYGSTELVFENEDEIHLHGTILFSLQNSPTQLTVNIYRLSVIPTAWYFWHFVYLRGKHMTVLFHGLLQALQSKVVGLS
jgi:hypothetical protein